ncbi:MAG: response regulator [Deltaproteobacteria bacterium]|nr:response regulator [Deltaproteobacteria bacterium]
MDIKKCPVTIHHIINITFTPDRKKMSKYESEIEKKRLAILKPLELALKDKGTLTEKYSSLLSQTLAARKEYIDDLTSDLEEITQEIIKTESFKDMLPLLGTKYAIERTLLAEERNILAERSNLFGKKRTKASVKRTELSEKRSGFARIRTVLARRRSFLSEKRTIMAQQRNLLAKARTDLAFIRTGVAFITLATGLIRYFGISWWTVLDASILLLGGIMVIIGIYYYLPTRKREVGLLKTLRQKEDELMNKKASIMVIDDDPAICDLLKVFFNKKGYEVEACVDPLIACQRLEYTQFDIVITDLMMDNMSGDQIVHLLKRLSPETPIIMVSFMPSSEESIINIRDNIFAFFPKPLDLKALHQSVKKAILEQTFNSRNNQ